MRSSLPILVVLLLAACGTLSVAVETTVEDELEFSHLIRLTATGGMVEEVEEVLDVNELRANGWDARSLLENGTLSLTLQRRFTGDEARIYSRGGHLDVDFPFKSFVIKVEESEGDVEYQVSLLLARGDGSATSEGFESYGFSRLRGLMVRSSADAFTLDWTLTVPGEIIDGNADRVEGGVARWRLDLQDLEWPVDLRVNSVVEKRGGGGACSRPRR